eukprot:Clim_evm45s199 gene=Clim_evmTU45s199
MPTSDTRDMVVSMEHPGRLINDAIESILGGYGSDAYLRDLLSRYHNDFVKPLDNNGPDPGDRSQLRGTDVLYAGRTKQYITQEFKDLVCNLSDALKLNERECAGFLLQALGAAGDDRSAATQHAIGSYGDTRIQFLEAYTMLLRIGSGYVDAPAEATGVVRKALSSVFASGNIFNNIFAAYERCLNSARDMPQQVRNIRLKSIELELFHLGKVLYYASEYAGGLSADDISNALQLTRKVAQMTPQSGAGNSGQQDQEFTDFLQSVNPSVQAAIMFAMFKTVIMYVKPWSSLGSTSADDEFRLAEAAREFEESFSTLNTSVGSRTDIPESMRDVLEMCAALAQQFVLDASVMGEEGRRNSLNRGLSLLSTQLLQSPYFGASDIDRDVFLALMDDYLQLYLEKRENVVDVREQISLARDQEIELQQNQELGVQDEQVAMDPSMYRTVSELFRFAEALYASSAPLSEALWLQNGNAVLQVLVQSDADMPYDLLPSYLKMLAALAQTSTGASHIFSMLNQSQRQGIAHAVFQHDKLRRLCWEFFFSTLLVGYIEEFSKYANGSGIGMLGSSGHADQALSLDQGEEELILSFLQLIAAVSKQNDASCRMMLRGWGADPLQLLITFLTLPTDAKVKTYLLKVLTAFASDADGRQRIWYAVDQHHLLENFFIPEFEIREAQMQSYPITLEFLNLLNSLLDQLPPKDFQPGGLQQADDSMLRTYAQYVRDRLLRKITLRNFKNSYERLSFFTTAFSLIKKMLVQFLDEVENENRAMKSDQTEEQERSRMAQGVDRRRIEAGVDLLSTLMRPSDFLYDILSVFRSAEATYVQLVQNNFAIDTVEGQNMKSAVPEALDAILDVLGMILAREDVLLNDQQTVRGLNGALGLCKSILTVQVDHLTYGGVGDQRDSTDHIVVVIGRMMIHTEIMQGALSQKAMHVLHSMCGRPQVAEQVLAIIAQSESSVTILEGVRKLFTKPPMNETGSATLANAVKEDEVYTPPSKTLQITMLQTLQEWLEGPGRNLALWLLGFKANQSMKQLYLDNPPDGLLSEFADMLQQLVGDDLASSADSLRMLLASPSVYGIIFRILYHLMSSPDTQEITFHFLHSMGHLIFVHLQSLALRNIGAQRVQEQGALMLIKVSRSDTYLLKTYANILHFAERTDNRLVLETNVNFLIMNNNFQIQDHPIGDAHQRQQSLPILQLLELQSLKIMEPAEINARYFTKTAMEYFMFTDPYSGASVYDMPALQEYLIGEVRRLGGSYGEAVLLEEAESLYQYADSYNEHKLRLSATNAYLDAWRQILEVTLISSNEIICSESSGFIALQTIAQDLLQKIKNCSDGLYQNLARSLTICMNRLSRHPCIDQMTGEQFRGFLSQFSACYVSRSLDRESRLHLAVALTDLMRVVTEETRADPQNLDREGSMFSSSSLTAEPAKQRFLTSVLSKELTNLVSHFIRDALYSDRALRALALMAISALCRADASGRCLQYLIDGTGGSARSAERPLKALVTGITSEDVDINGALRRHQLGQVNSYALECKLALLLHVSMSRDGCMTLVQEGILRVIADLKFPSSRPSRSASISSAGDVRVWSDTPFLLPPAGTGGTGGGLPLLTGSAASTTNVISVYGQQGAGSQPGVIGMPFLDREVPQMIAELKAVANPELQIYQTLATPIWRLLLMIGHYYGSRQESRGRPIRAGATDLNDRDMGYSGVQGTIRQGFLMCVSSHMETIGSILRDKFYSSDLHDVEELHYTVRVADRALQLSVASQDEDNMSLVELVPLRIQLVQLLTGLSKAQAMAEVVAPLGSAFLAVAIDAHAANMTSLHLGLIASLFSSVRLMASENLLPHSAADAQAGGNTHTDQFVAIATAFLQNAVSGFEEGWHRTAEIHQDLRQVDAKLSGTDSLGASDEVTSTDLLDKYFCRRMTDPERITETVEGPMVTNRRLRNHMVAALNYARSRTAALKEGVENAILLLKALLPAASAVKDIPEHREVREVLHKVLLLQSKTQNDDGASTARKQLQAELSSTLSFATFVTHEVLRTLGDSGNRLTDGGPSMANE